MTEYHIDPIQWFVQRELSFKPKHFISTNTPLTLQSKQWIVHTLKGRYFLEERSTEDNFLSDIFPSFENSSEAVMYELRWS